ncbi:hypothetical protein HMF7854_03790 [Sphingomonas ginkgonis]|uniref:Lipoprotein n=1 Tax=Sphingomonas ginkgonis TaxID=2315330 RepID=A0A429V7W2_9SPHN|nr:hypothetical protein [Sphingomonas ginkgonis]RST30043.1 hypothetical protein HMF7854_03790 [Sphingomonas ginkgonis]
MIPVKHSNIFRSRWWALIWAAGIIWFACDVAGGAPQSDGNNAAANAADASGDLADRNTVDQAAGIIANL